MVDLASFLISCGARIQGAGTSTLSITGARKLHGTEYQIIPDRIEAGTFLIAAAITRSVISMSPVVPKHLSSVMGKLRMMGCRIQQTRWNSLWVCPDHDLILVSVLFFCLLLVLNPFRALRFIFILIGYRIVVHITYVLVYVIILENLFKPCHVSFVTSYDALFLQVAPSIQAYALEPLEW